MVQKQGKETTYLGTKAVPQRANLGEPLVLQVLERQLDDRIHVREGMRVLAIAALVKPLHEVEVGRPPIQRQRVAVEDVDDECGVAVGGKLIRHQLGVLPDADHVRDVQQRCAVVLYAAFGLRDVGFVRPGFEGRAGGLAPGGGGWGRGSALVWGLWKLPGQERGAHSCLTPMVQHWAGGLEAILGGLE